MGMGMDDDDALLFENNNKKNQTGMFVRGECNDRGRRQRRHRPPHNYIMW